MTGKSVTLTKSQPKPFIRFGEVIKTNAFGNKRYNIVLSDSEDKKIIDEDGDNALCATITLRKISKWLLIRKVQIFYYRNFYQPKK